jgi:tRNA threonylcarbamoyladenosine biosynthesis protein TsaE
MKVISNSVGQTRLYGAQCATASAPGDIIALIGSLGSGKTEFVRGFTTALSPRAPVRSPSFALAYTYETPRFLVCHFDFYRLKNSGELREIGFSDYVRDDTVCLIEWADMFPEALPPKILKIYFTDDAQEPDRRILESDFPFMQE